MQEEVKHYKVKSLPTKLRPSSVYYVKETSQNTVKTYITDQNGIPYPLIDLEGGGGTGNITSVTGTGVTGTSSNPVVNISTFKSSQLGNLIELSSSDGKLFVKPITSPDGSIDIVSTATSLEIQLGASLQTQIQNALQSGDNISELTNDAGYITLADIPFSSVAATAWTPNHTVATGNPYLTGTIVYYLGHVFQANLNNDSIPPEIGGNLYWEDLGVGYLIDQEQTDWLAVSGSAFIKNKPTNVSSFTNDAGYITLEDFSGYVPYTGATQNVNLGEYSISAGQLQFDTTPTGSGGVGVLRWNTDDGTLDLGLKGGNVTLQIGQETVYEVRNQTGNTILNGTSVYANGVTSGSSRITAAPFIADGTIREVRYLGLATEDISNGINGFVTYFGYVRGLDTRGNYQSSIAVGNETWAVGDILYAHPTVAGKLTNVRPQHDIIVAIIINRHQNNGVLFVRPSSFGHLDDLHDVSISNETHGDLIQYNSSTGLWENKKSYFSFKSSQRGNEVSNTTTETEICRVLLPKDTFSEVDVLNVASLMVSKEGTDTKYTIYIRLSQSEIFSSGHELIAAYSVNGTTQLTNIERTFFIRGQSIKGLSKSDTTKVTDKNDSIYPIGELFFDRSKDYYLYISVQTDSPSPDRIRFEGININNI